MCLLNTPSGFNEEQNDVHINHHTIQSLTKLLLIPHKFSDTNAMSAICKSLNCLKEQKKANYWFSSFRDTRKELFSEYPTTSKSLPRFAFIQGLWLPTSSVQVTRQKKRTTMNKMSSLLRIQTENPEFFAPFTRFQTTFFFCWSKRN